MKLSFLLFALPFIALIAIAEIAVYKAGINFGLIRSNLAKNIFSWILILLPIILVLTMTIGNKYYNTINVFFYHIAVTWLPILIYLVLGVILLSIIKLIAVNFGIPINMYTLSVSVIFIIFGFVTFGIMNATMPRVVTYEINSSKLLGNWSGKNIVLVSDTHLGVVRSQKFMNRVANLIQEQNPSMVLIAGDLIDGPVFDYEKGLAPLGKIRTEYGVFFTPGNHETYNPEPDRFYPIVDSVVTRLSNNKAEINNTDIIGLDYKIESDASVIERLNMAGYEKSRPSIAIIHDPKNVPSLQDAGVDLIVSGHTHCGQFFPMNLIVRSIYKKYTYGLNIRGESSAVTTCGVGTAMSPLRLGTNPEIVVLKVK